ncbi:hypothetical protein ACH5RR_007198 [Cinchona calisaya]|uniref:Reverse transcriptase n=1 Tax=Cinchona calisaya TaxID=153742 RepID=A0ABD3AR23_9GENT
MIESTESPHSSPAFMVRKYSQIKRGKPIMVINYKKLNKNLVFDRCFIPRKDVLVNRTRGSKVYSKFDCKSGFWQIKLYKESKLFSAPYGNYQGTLLALGICNAL